MSGERAHLFLEVLQSCPRAPSQGKGEPSTHFGFEVRLLEL